MIEYGPLAEWKTIAGGGQDMQDVFWYIKEAIDAYFAGGPFSVTVKAGCVVGRKPARRATDRPAAERRAAGGQRVVTAPFTAVSDTQEDSQFDERETVLPWSPRSVARGSAPAAEPDHADIPELASTDFALDEGSLSGSAAEQVAGQVAEQVAEPVAEPVAEQVIDAFVEGRQRPRHLAD